MKAMDNPRHSALLTIAGFDPSSGAGVTADLQVFAAHRRFGTSCITALTVQSTTGVRRVEPVQRATVRETLLCLHEDLPPAGVKIGMLATLANVRAVVDYLEVAAPDSLVVLDPVLRSSSGADLLEVDGLKALMGELLPLVHWITPNLDELEILLGRTVLTSIEGIQAAAQELASRSPHLGIVVTGGSSNPPDDFVLPSGEQGFWLPGEHVETQATHGTGCAFSSALLCNLLEGQKASLATANAKRYVAEAMRQATLRGNGKGPMHLLWPLTESF